MHTGIVKTSHHAVFDECWFDHSWRPPAAQLLYDLGTAVSNDLPQPTPPPTLPSTDDTPPIIRPTTDSDRPFATLPNLPMHPITDNEGSSDDDTSASSDSTSRPPSLQVLITTLSPQTNPDASAVEHYDITRRDIAQIYCSPHHYGHTFEEVFDYMGSASLVHPTAGLVLEEKDGRVFIRDITAGTPCAKRTRVSSASTIHRFHPSQRPKHIYHNYLRLLVAHVDS